MSARVVISLWVVALLVALAVLVVVIPQLLYPPLSASDLRGLTSADKRVELQQAQSALRNNSRGLLVQAFAGLLLTAGAVASWRQLHISREGQFTERFTRAVDQIGAEQLSVRLGGIYALERLANNSAGDRAVIGEILAAFVRVKAPWAVDAPGVPQHPTPTLERLPWMADAAADVQAALAVLGRRLPAAGEPRLQLSRVDLRRAYLSRARLASANIRHANLSCAWMRHIILDDADLVDTDLREADLQDATLSGAKLREAHLDRAKLRNACLTRAVLVGASLRGADLRGADLRSADLREADLRGSNLQDATLEGADLTGARHDETTVWPAAFEMPDADPATLTTERLYPESSAKQGPERST